MAAADEYLHQFWEMFAPSRRTDTKKPNLNSSASCHDSIPARAIPWLMPVIFSS
jgi:hypothetical protein